MKLDSKMTRGLPRDRGGVLLLVGCGLCIAGAADEAKCGFLCCAGDV
jgi:hypothetical protein